MQKKATQVNEFKLAYSIKELSQLTGICERKIHYEIKKGNLKPSRIGRRILVVSAEAIRWLNDAAK